MLETEIIDSYPLSPMQQAMFFQSQLSPETGMYLLQLECELNENLNPEVFWRAWRAVMERHSILRTSFHVSLEGDPYQAVHAHVHTPIFEQDLRGLPAGEQGIRIQEYLKSDWKKGFNLGSPPLLRLALFRLGEEKFRFVRTIHHLLSDSRSSFVQYQEVFSLYESLRSGKDLVLPLAKDYREYIDWIMLQDRSDVEAFWRDILRSFQTPTPLIRTSPAIPFRSGNDDLEGSDFSSQSLRIPVDSTNKLRSFSTQHGITLNSLLQAAWAVLLSRYSGEEDVIFGGTRNCRKSSFQGAENIVGPMVNTLPVRVRLSPNQPVFSLLKDIREQWVRMRPYENSPLPNIARWSEVPAGARLFESVVNYDHLSFNAALQAQAGAWINRTFRYRQNPGYILTLNGFGEPEFLLQIIYDRLAFDDEFIQRMLRHVETLLMSIVDHPDKPASRLPMLTEEEKYQTVQLWNDTESDFPTDRLVHELVESQAANSPDRTALVFRDQKISYGELNKRSNQLARYLRTQGVGPDCLVGIYMVRSPEIVMAVLAVLKSGGAFLPLDPQSPEDRLRFMLTDARPVLVLSQEFPENKLSGMDMPAFYIDRERKAINLQPDGNLESLVKLEHLAYVIFTSGSTGTPKGVELTHAGLLNLVSWHQKEFNVGALDRATQVANFSFDASVWEIWPYLASGAQIHLLPDEIDLAPERLLAWYAREGITISFLPTPVFESMLHMKWPENIALRILFTGGDRLHRRPPGKLPFQLINNYGPTECTVVSTSGEVLPVSELESSNLETTPDIGRPIANLKVFVLDRYLNPVPVGVPGELFIGGVGIGRGYLRRPELTAVHFIECPFEPFQGERMYRTGDVARFLPDGRLEFLGRADTQVKVRGMRMELGEIEALLQHHPAIIQAAVMSVSKENGTVLLVAYLEKVKNTKVDSKELLIYLRMKLPAQMVPSDFVFLEELPLTPNGKVDRKALVQIPFPVERPSMDEAMQVRPRTALEKVIAGLWGEVLGRQEVGVHDNFFDLGGHSLLAIRLVSQLGELFQIELPLKMVFDAPTVESMAASLVNSVGEMAGLEETAELLLQISKMTESEAERQLAEKIAHRR